MSHVDDNNEAAIVSRAMQTVAKEVEQRLQKLTGREDIGLSLFVWSRGRSNYVSNVDRGLVQTVLETHIAGWKAGMPDIPAHQVD
jgi:hypothetical protein